MNEFLQAHPFLAWTVVVIIFSPGWLTILITLVDLMHNLSEMR